MSYTDIERLKSVKDFNALVEYLRDELDWPIEVEDAEDITYDYESKELGIEEKYAAKIKNIKQIRPLTDNQPWGIFYTEFEPKKLPVVVLRRILRSLIYFRRKANDRMATWGLADLMFISSLGESNERKISLAHFSESEYGLPELRTFSWDASDTYFHYLQNKMDLEKLRWPEKEDDVDAWREQWYSAFTLRHRGVIRTSQDLAIEMAHLAAQIRDQIKTVFEYEVPDGPLHKLFENFEKVLIYDLKMDTFADMYAQTIAYGLFSARATHEGEFEIENISAMIPHTNPFLKSLFEECTKIGATDSESLDLEELGVVELIKMLKDSNIEAVLQDFGRQKRGEDLVIHLYELFLKEYDLEQKVKRGIFYTPDPVVSFIVRSVDYLLIKEFDCPDGLADTSTMPVKVKSTTKNGEVVEEIKQVPKVQILDPATGTGTFLKYVTKEIKKTFDEKNKDLSEEGLREKWNEYVDKNLLPRVFGFELLMAPYAVAHLKLGLELKETEYAFQSEKRLRVYLNNTLEGTHKGAGTLDTYNWLADEGLKANEVKANDPISVVIGNPPYSGESANDCRWIADLLRGKITDGARKSNYFEVDGGSLGERNPKWLNDDYVKFIRFGQWRIDKTGQGVLAFITNHSYLDNPTFRGMRQQLMESFNDIYLLDLHGNSLKREKCPDGSKDENVFDIKQGVSIGIFVKNPNKKGYADIRHADLWGLRENKYNKLLGNTIETIDWEEVYPNASFYLFMPQDYELNEEYEKGWKITDIMPINSVGIVTARDKLTIQDSPEKVWKIITDFSNLPEEEARTKYNLDKDARDWKVSFAQKDLRKSGLKEELIIPILYRPFNMRYTYYTGHSRGFICMPRPEVMWHMMQENLGLITCRQQNKIGFYHTFVSDVIIESCVVSNKTREIDYLFPLHLYGKNNAKTSNFNSKILESLREIYNKEPMPEEIFYYIYAILHSQEYRNRYAEFLKIDFPKIPFTSSYELFSELSKFGEQLASLHLMRSNKLNDLITTFESEGNNEVGSIGKNSYRDGRLYLNRTQYFDGISEEVYNFHIGGYQVCQKWLKDRKDQTLSEEEIVHYQKIVVAINETIQIMEEIDEAIEDHGGWPIK